MGECGGAKKREGDQGETEGESAVPTHTCPIVHRQPQNGKRAWGAWGNPAKLWVGRHSQKAHEAHAESFPPIAFGDPFVAPSTRPIVRTGSRAAAGRSDGRWSPGRPRARGSRWHPDRLWQQQ